MTVQGQSVSITVCSMFGEKISLSRHVNFFPEFKQKNHRFRHLETIWDGFGQFKYLKIWELGNKNNVLWHRTLHMSEVHNRTLPLLYGFFTV